MEQLLTEALDAGFLGMSAQQLLFDKLDGELCRSRTLPSTYAGGAEMRGLRRILRRRGRALQAGPDASHPHTIVIEALRSIGLLGRSPLKTSLLSAADIKAIPFVIHLMRGLARGGQPARRPTSAGSTCRCRSRCTPTASTW